MKVTLRCAIHLLTLAGLIAFSSTTLAAEEPPFLLPPRQDLSRIRSAEVTTSRGSFLVELYPEEAPWHIANFKYRADKGLYRGSSFHIVQPGYIIQGGALKHGVKGGGMYTLPAEFSLHRHETGALGMARQSNHKNPERRSDGSQFHILLGDAPHMNGSYTIFGKVIRGMDVVESIQRGDPILEVKVFVRR
jgi:cyclophilin family peptidyl-prolyl cis-trans isomerase